MSGGGNAQFNLAPDTAWDKMKLLGIKPLHNTFTITDAQTGMTIVYRRMQ